MARVNTVAHKVPGPVTHEGAPARRIDAEQELQRTALACLLWEDSFYESGEDVATRLTNLCLEVEPAAIAAIAIEARSAMKLRHLPLFLCVQLARRKALKADTLATVIQRADELAEFVALYWKYGKLPLAAQVKKGLAKAFQKFNAYSLAKYNRDGAVKLRDVLFLCHAKPKNEEQAATWKQLADGTLASPDTWEVELSAGKDKKETWERLIAENKLGALALLRNLRNMGTANVTQGAIRSALTTMQTERVLPFRFISAAKYAPIFEPELEAAMFRSLAEMPKLSGHTVLLVDVSGSMSGAPVSQRSEIDRLEAASALAMLVREVCERVTVVAFGTQAGLCPPRRGFALRDILRAAQQQCGGGTNTENGKQCADAQGPYDRIILITDEQSHQVISAPKGKGYCINVGSYKNGIGYGKWTHIDGWSEAVLSYIAASESVATPTGIPQ